MTAPPVLWQPSATDRVPALATFQEWLRARTGRPLPDWATLRAWSVERYPEFWAHFLEWSGVEWQGSNEPACDGDQVEFAEFFPNVRLNAAWNLVRPLGDDDEWPALIGASESGPGIRLTRGALRRRVAMAAGGLQRLGVCPGDRVVALVRNTPETVVVALACTAIGATWSAAAPDMGADALLSRFSQLDPVVLVAHGEATTQGVSRQLGDRLEALERQLGTVRHVIALDESAAVHPWARPVHRLTDVESGAPIGEWPALPFSHPLYVLFSSGTTGAPKGIVHGAGGTLLEHLKEHRLHGDLGPGDVLLYQTTCGWMMWNWMVSALGAGAAVVCHDGSPTHPTMDHLWRLAADLGVTAFGTNPTYLAACEEAGLVPREAADLGRLRAVLSTGSVLRGAQFEWVARNVGDVPVQSISGGTDIIGCFVLGNPLLPVYRGESQCVSLGLDVRVLTGEGLRHTGTGELVCCRPFPSRPVYFVRDPDRARFHDTYFAQNPGLWTHGDIIELTDRGTARVLGRSDGTLNVRGVRIGPAEIYGVVLEDLAVRQAMAVEQPAPREPGGSRLVLLLVLHPGHTLDRPLALRLKKALATRLSPNHVPAVIVQVAELPTTFSGKQSERAVRDVLAGREAANSSAIRNPAALASLRALAAPSGTLAPSEPPTGRSVRQGSQ